MLIALGILLFVVGLIAFFIAPTAKQKENKENTIASKKNLLVKFTEENDTRGVYTVQSELDKLTSSPIEMIMEKFSRKWAKILAIAGFVIMMLPGLFFYAQPGYQYFRVGLFGKQSAVMETGIRWKGFAPRVDAWQKYIDVKVPGTSEDVKEVEGVMQPVPIRFIDQVTATVGLSTRFQIPNTDEPFMAMAVKFRKMENLVQNTLIPTVEEVVSNTGYQFAAQDYISGAASDFREAIDYQLKYGGYSVEKNEYYDTLNVDIQDLGDRGIGEIRTRYEVEKRTYTTGPDSGEYILIPHDIVENGIIVSQVIVDDVFLETDFKDRLKAQRDESALRQLEQQKIKTAKDSQARIIAEGEKDKAAERVDQEKAQISVLIAKETLLKEEETNRQLAVIALKTEKLNAAKVKVKADAAAYEIRMKVNAGITPEVRLQMELDRDVAVMAEIAKTNWPTNYFNMGGSKGTGAMSSIEALLSVALADQIKPKK
jgi:hypothetical protein